MSTSSTLPNYGPEMFEKAEKESNFIAARGTVPVISNEGKKETGQIYLSNALAIIQKSWSILWSMVVLLKVLGPISMVI
jgi:hypothetical protein